MKKAVILARVSTSRQEKEGLSLDEIQLPELRRYAEEHGLEVVQEFRFSESADNKIRRKFNEMVDVVKSDKSIKAIIAYRVDRITRNYRDAVLIDELRLEHDKEIHFVNDRIVLTKETVGRDITDWDLKVFLAKQYINRLKEDAINSADRMLERGQWPVNAPFGYKNVTLDSKKKWIEIEPAKSAIVRKIYEWYCTSGYSMNEIKKKVKDVFGHSISKGMVDKILKNPFYCGTMKYKGKTFPHAYECLIDKEIFDQVQDVKAGFNRKHFKYAGLPYFYRGLITCPDCGCAITPEMKKGKYVYYHCTEYKGKHGAKWVNEEEITRQLAEVYKGMEIPDDVLQKLISVLKESHDGKKRFNDELFTTLNQDYKKYQNRIEKMYDDKLDGQISGEEYEKRLDDYKQKQEEISIKLSRLKRADEEYYITSEYILRLASKASELFQSSEMEERRQLLQLSLQNLRLDGKIILFDVKKPFDTILRYTKSQRWLPRVDSNHGHFA